MAVVDCEVEAEVVCTVPVYVAVVAVVDWLVVAVVDCDVDAEVDE